MYQVNIPQIYRELEGRSYKSMSKVIICGSVVSILLYTFIGIFAYLTFVKDSDSISTNILEANYQNNIAITIV